MGQTLSQDRETQHKTSRAWISAKEVATILGVSKQTVYRLVEKGVFTICYKSPPSAAVRQFLVSKQSVIQYKNSLIQDGQF